MNPQIDPERAAIIAGAVSSVVNAVAACYLNEAEMRAVMAGATFVLLGAVPPAIPIQTGSQTVQ